MATFFCVVVPEFRAAVSFVQTQCTGFAFRFEHRKWNRGRIGLHQLGQPVAPSILFPAFKSEGEPGTAPQEMERI